MPGYQAISSLRLRESTLGIYEKIRFRPFEFIADAARKAPQTIAWRGRERLGSGRRLPNDAEREASVGATIDIGFPARVIESSCGRRSPGRRRASEPGRREQLPLRPRSLFRCAISLIPEWMPPIRPVPTRDAGDG